MSFPTNDLPPSPRGFRRRAHRFVPLDVVALGLVVAGTVVHVCRTLEPDRIVSSYQAPLYWLGYQFGFVRRGLPGEVLSWATGAGPTRTAAFTAGALLSAAAVTALIVLTHLARRSAGSSRSSWTLTCVLLASPFGLSMLARDIGRYDSIGYVALAATAVLGRAPGRPALRAALTSAVVVVATLTEEFLLAYLCVVVLRATCTWAEGLRRRVVLAAIALGPGCVAAIVSLQVRVPPARLDGVVATARAAGIPGAPLFPENNAVQNLSRNFAQQLELFHYYNRVSVVVTPVVLGLFFALLVHTCAPLAGWARGPVLFSAVSAAAVALALGVVGVDFRRWWALAFFAVVAALTTTGPAVQESGVRRRRPALETLTLVGCVLSQNIPFVPLDDQWLRLLTQE